MVKARIIGAHTIKRKLLESDYQWNYRPGWEYAGKARVIQGHEVDARSFSIRTNAVIGVRWTFDMQVWAVTQGFFVHRELIRERPVIIGTNRFDHSTFSYWEPYKTMQEIERRVFRREPRYGILLDFIKQQDLYGYTGAWDAGVQCFTPDLLWYKLHVQEVVMGRGGRKRVLRQRAAVAREARYVKRVRKMILTGHKT